MEKDCQAFASTVVISEHGGIVVETWAFHLSTSVTSAVTCLDVEGRLEDRVRAEVKNSTLHVLNGKQ